MMIIYPTQQAKLSLSMKHDTSEVSTIGRHEREWEALGLILLGSEVGQAMCLPQGMKASWHIF